MALNKEWKSENSVWNSEIKSKIIKNLLFELLVNTKKELQIKEKPLLESSIILNCSFGTAERDD